MHEIDRILAAIRRILDANERGIVVTIVATRGSTYRRAGGRAVISERGEAFGMISGGCVERDLVERTRVWLADFRPRLFTYDSSRENDIVFGLGLGCSGELDLLIEPFDAAHPPQLLSAFAWNGREPVVLTTTFEGRELLTEVIHPQRSVLLFGGGPDVEPLVRVAQSIGWRVQVVSPKDIHPERVKEMVDIRLHDAAVVMTHNYMHDVALLDALLPAPIAYVGLLGPRRRAENVLNELPHIDAEARQRLRSPIGVDLGGDTPEEIALSIVAEIQAVLNARAAGFLRDRNAPIHEPAPAKSCA